MAGQKLYRIGEVAKIVGVQPEKIRYWERFLKTVPATTTQGRHRLYTQENIKVLKRVKQLIELNLPVHKACTIAEKLTSNNKNLSFHEKLLTLIDEIDEFLQELEEILDNNLR